MSFGQTEIFILDITRSAICVEKNVGTGQALWENISFFTSQSKNILVVEIKSIELTNKMGSLQGRK